jgi:hypothetical protein
MRKPNDDGTAHLKPPSESANGEDTPEHPRIVQAEKHGETVEMHPSATETSNE